MFKSKKNEDSDRKDEYFLKIGLTNDGKLNIYIGWPRDNDEKVVERLTLLLDGIFNGRFTTTIQHNLLQIDDDLLKQVLQKYNITTKKYINPLDVM